MRWFYGKILIVEFENDEEIFFQQALDYLVNELSDKPKLVKTNSDLSINPLTRKFINNNGEEIYLTAKEFDLLYFLYSHKGQVFSKEQIYENVWGYGDTLSSRNLTSFIRKFRKKQQNSLYFS